MRLTHQSSVGAVVTWLGFHGAQNAAAVERGQCELDQRVQQRAVLVWLDGESPGELAEISLERCAERGRGEPIRWPARRFMGEPAARR